MSPASKTPLPLFRQLFAALLCRYVGIASPAASTHTRAMHWFKKILCFLLAGSLATGFAGGVAALDDSAEGEIERERNNLDNKHILVSQTQRWVAQNRQLDQSVVEVAPSDRRLIIPLCDSPFEFNYPFTTSQKTLRASCPDSGWQIFLGITIHQTDNALRYSGSFSAGHKLNAGDIESVNLSSPIAGLAIDAAAIEGLTLSVAVRAGDLVMQRQLSTSIEAFRLKRDILAGEIIDSGAVEMVLLAAANLTENQKLSADRLNGARAARDLKMGKLLSSYDIKEKHLVLITQAGMARGQPVTRANIALQDYYGKLPSDALHDYSSAEQMQAIRNLPAGNLLRLSDLTPVNIIRKGDNVQLTVRSGALEITVTMLALENARLDQRVLLLNPESNEEIQAVATGPGQARGL